MKISLKLIPGCAVCGRLSAASGVGLVLYLYINIRGIKSIPKMVEKKQQTEIPAGGRMSGRTKKRTYFHKAYGMRFRSEVFWPRVPISSETGFDVDIQMGDVPHALSDPKVCGYKFQAKPSQILLQTIHIADFHVTGGEKIIIQPKNGDHRETVQTLLWGWAMAALLHQRDVFPLHGSVIKSGEEAIVFCGPSGFGKSTITMALVKRGFQILDDNMALLFFNDNDVYVHPGIPEIKIHTKDVPIAWENQLSVQGLFPESDKLLLDMSRHYFAIPLPVTTVFILSKFHKQRDINALKGSEKIKALENNVFCGRFIKGLGKTGPLFKFLIRLSQRLRVFLIREHCWGDVPAHLIDQLERERFIMP